MFLQHIVRKFHSTHFLNVFVLIFTDAWWVEAESNRSFEIIDDVPAEGPKYMAIAGEQLSEVNILLQISISSRELCYFCCSQLFAVSVFLMVKGRNMGSQHCRKMYAITSKQLWGLSKLFVQRKRSFFSYITFWLMTLVLVISVKQYIRVVHIEPLCMHTHKFDPLTWLNGCIW